MDAKSTLGSTLNSSVRNLKNLYPSVYQIIKDGFTQVTSNLPHENKQFISDRYFYCNICKISHIRSFFLYFENLKYICSASYNPYSWLSNKCLSNYINTPPISPTVKPHIYYKKKFLLTYEL